VLLVRASRGATDDDDALDSGGTESACGGPFLLRCRCAWFPRPALLVLVVLPVLVLPLLFRGPRKCLRKFAMLLGDDIWRQIGAARWRTVSPVAC